MSGITAAQYLKKKLDVVVFNKVDSTNGQNYCFVRQGGGIVSRARDDPYCTLGWLTANNLFEKAYSLFNLKRKYKMPPSSSFLSQFDVNVIRQFDTKWFTDEVLPAIQGKTNILGIAEMYKEYDFDTTDPAEMYEIYDWIVRLYVQLRQMKWDVNNIKVEGKPTRTILEVISNLGAADLVTFPPGTESMLPVLETVHSGVTKVKTTAGDVYVCDPSKHEVDPLGLSGTTFMDINWDYQTGEDATADEEGSESLSVASARSADLPEIIQRVVRCLGTPHQSMSPEDLEFISSGGKPEMLDPTKGGLGRNKLAGLGRICGQGPVAQCIDRVYNHIKTTLVTKDNADIYNLAAGRIARMSSDKKTVKIQGEYHIVKRA